MKNQLREEKEVLFHPAATGLDTTYTESKTQKEERLTGKPVELEFV